MDYDELFEDADLLAEYDDGMEELRAALLNEMYAGGFSGYPAMLLDEERIRNATGAELLTIAQRYGLG